MREVLWFQNNVARNSWFSLLVTKTGSIGADAISGLLKPADTDCPRSKTVETADNTRHWLRSSHGEKFLHAGNLRTVVWLVRLFPAYTSFVRHVHTAIFSPRPVLWLTWEGRWDFLRSTLASTDLQLCHHCSLHLQSMAFKPALLVLQVLCYGYVFGFFSGPVSACLFCKACRERRL